MPIESPRSTLKFSAQTRSYGLKISENTESKSTSSVKTPKKIPQSKVYSVLPKYNTPVRKPVKNPFNERLLELVNGPVCSPDLCSSVASPSENNKNEFFWTVDDIWRIDPAPIESPQTDLEDNLDDETESLVQEAIERYFQESHNILSPIGSPKSFVFSKRSLTPEFPTPKCQSERAMSTPCTRYDSRRTMKTSVALQTTLSFNTDLPEDVLDLLKPFLNVLNESKNDSNNMSSSTLRRKLLFNELAESSDNSECENNDGEKKIVSRFLASDWTPDKVQSTAEMFTKSPDISPIADGIICNNDYFNFTREMAIDISTSPIKVTNENDRHMSIDYCREDTSLGRSRSPQTSTDTGYNTNASLKSDKSQPTSDKVMGGIKMMRSYVGSGDTVATNTGITSTPRKAQ